MDIVPEIPCSCGQKVCVDRDCCPYCGATVKGYWYDDLGEVKRAVPFSENGKNYLYSGGEKLALDMQSDIPRSLQQCLGKSPKSNYESISQRAQQFMNKALSNWFSPDPPLPAQWDIWLDSTQIMPEVFDVKATTQNQVPQNRPSFEQRAYSGSQLQTSSKLARMFIKWLQQFPPEQQQFILWAGFVTIMLLYIIYSYHCPTYTSHCVRDLFGYLASLF